jgi:hypothetical protein
LHALTDIPWLPTLDREEHAAVVAELKVVRVATGELLCRSDARSPTGSA